MAFVCSCFMACSSDDGGSIIGPEPSPADTIEEPEPLSTELRQVLTDGKKFVYGNASTNEIQQTKIVVGDTLCDSKEAKVLRTTNYSSITNSEYDAYSVQYEKSGRIFSQYTQPYPIEDSPSPWTRDGNWCVIVDMLSHVGDKIISVEETVVESKGTIVIMGRTLRAVKVKYLSSYHIYPRDYDYWVEGIGSVYGREPLYSMILPTGRYEIDKALLECYDGDDKIFDYREFDESTYKPGVDW